MNKNTTRIQSGKNDHHFSDITNSNSPLLLVLSSSIHIKASPGEEDPTRSWTPLTPKPPYPETFSCRRLTLPSWGLLSSPPHCPRLSDLTRTRWPRVCARAGATPPPAPGRAADAQALPATPDGRPGPSAPAPDPPGPSQLPGFAPRGARCPRRRTLDSPTRSVPSRQQQAEGQIRVGVGKQTAQPGNRPVETAIFSCSPTQPPARTAT